MLNFLTVAVCYYGIWPVFPKVTYNTGFFYKWIPKLNFCPTHTLTPLLQMSYITKYSMVLLKRWSRVFYVKSFKGLFVEDS